LLMRCGVERKPLARPDSGKRSYFNRETLLAVRFLPL
jgi:hypothetical protein